MRQMDDNLIVRIATIQTIVMSILFNTATWLQLQGQTFGIPVKLFFYLYCASLGYPSHKGSYINDVRQFLMICFRPVLEFC